MVLLLKNGIVALKKMTQNCWIDQNPLLENTIFEQHFLINASFSVEGAGAATLSYYRPSSHDCYVLSLYGMRKGVTFPSHELGPRSIALLQQNWFLECSLPKLVCA